MAPKLGKNSQQWIFDYLINVTGKTAQWEYGAGAAAFPPEVKSWNMIHKVLGKHAARSEQFGKRAEEAGHARTAWEAYRRAVEQYYMAQHTICEDDHPEKIRLYQRLLACQEKVINFSEYPIEKIEIPWGDQTIPALFHLVPDRKKAPCILYVPGMDQCKESFPDVRGTIIQNPFMKRGIHVLSIDGPGQGESYIRKVRVRPDNHVDAAKAAIDYLMTRPEVDGDKIGLYGLSMGTYWAAHIAGADSRIKASATLMACFMMNRRPIFDEASPRFRLTYKYMAGIEDDDEFDEVIANKMTLKGVGQHIKHPFLVVQGEFDPLSPMEDAETFFNEIAGPKEMWVVENDFHSTHGTAFCDIPPAHIIADWLKDKLDGKYSPDLNKKLLVPQQGLGPYTTATE